MRPTRLEHAVLEWIASRQPSLSARLAAPVVARREHTGVGLYVYLSAEDDEWDRPPVDGPTIESPALEHSAGSILWLVRGAPQCLEIYAFGDRFPEHLDEFQLSLSDGSV